MPFLSFSCMIMPPDPRIRIRLACHADLPALLGICHDTVLAGQAPPRQLPFAWLPGCLYVEPYLHAVQAWVWVLEDAAGVVGYAAGAADSAAFYAWLNAQWLPPRRREGDNTVHSPAQSPGDAAGALATAALHARLMARLNSDWQVPSGLQAFPAHLHINLLPRAQGQGAGRRLIHRMLASLAQAGARGVHWGVDPANVAATGFYRKLGFTVVMEEPGCVWFASALP